MKTVGLLSLALLLLIAIPQSTSAQPQAEPEICQTVAFQGRQWQLCALIGAVYDDETDHSRWYLSDQQGRRELPESPSSFISVSGFQISPDQKLLAIESAGEGCPAVDVIDLTELLAHQQVRRLISIAPYPGDVALVGWRGKYLLIESTVLLSELGEDHQPIEFEDREQFLIDPTTGEINGYSANAIDPISYFIKQFQQSEDQEQLHQAINALVQLRAGEALPILQQALTNENDRELKQLLQQAIKDLSR